MVNHVRRLQFCLLPCFAAMLVFVMSATQPHYWKGLEVLENGYNIIRGNPKASHLDPGFADRIFDFSSGVIKSYEGTPYFWPDALDTILPTPECQFSSKSFVLNASAEIRFDFKDSIQLAGSLTDWKTITGALTASVGFHGFLDSIVNASLTITDTFGSCGIYRPMLVSPSTTKFNFSVPFVTKVHEIAKSPTVANLFQFLDDFGTHYLEAVDMGSRYGRFVFVADLKWKTFAELVGEANVTAYANALWHVVTAGAHGSTKLQIKMAQTFEAYLATVTESFIDCGLPQISQSIADWKKCSEGSPYAVNNYRLRPIFDLFNIRNFPDLPGLDLVAAILRTIWKKYCEHIPHCIP